MVGELVEGDEPPPGADAFPMRRAGERAGRLAQWLVMAPPTLEHFGQRINTVLRGGWSKANCEYCVDHRNKRVTVRTTRAITKGDELFAYYGDDYVRSIRRGIEAQAAESARETEEARQERLRGGSRGAGGFFVANPWRTCPFCDKRGLRGDEKLRLHLNICRAFHKKRKRAPLR